jgi:hypothetical protein
LIHEACGGECTVLRTAGHAWWKHSYWCTRCGAYFDGATWRVPENQTAATLQPNSGKTVGEWVAIYCEQHHLDWEMETLPVRREILRAIPCRIRCWRVGLPVDPENGKCPECGRPENQTSGATSIEHRAETSRPADGADEPGTIESDSEFATGMLGSFPLPPRGKQALWLAITSAFVMVRVNEREACAKVCLEAWEAFATMGQPTEGITMCLDGIRQLKGRK